MVVVVFAEIPVTLILDIPEPFAEVPVAATVVGVTVTAAFAINPFTAKS